MALHVMASKTQMLGRPFLLELHVYKYTGAFNTQCRGIQAAT